MMNAEHTQGNLDARYDAAAMAQLQRNGIRPVRSSVSGKHAYDVRGVPFLISERYELSKIIGVGAYGIVMSAMDTQTGVKVALKKVSSVFDDIVDGKRILREIRLMRLLNHENILPLIDMEDPESMERFVDVYLVSPLYDKDLGKVISSKVALSDEHIQYFVYQTLCALKYMHSASILHRDLKPGNILLQESCDVAICDLGLARYVDQNQDAANGMTEYVVTRWYRAPELVLTREYTNAVDMWSLGCVIGDLLGRKALFPGKDFKHQVEIICSIIGKPTAREMGHIKSARARMFLEKLPDLNHVPLENLYPDANPHALDLMMQLLKFLPEERITAEEALAHPYLAEYHDPAFETTAENMVDVYQLEPRREDGQDLTADDLKNMMLSEIYHFRPDATIFAEKPGLCLTTL